MGILFDQRFKRYEDLLEYEAIEKGRKKGIQEGRQEGLDEGLQQGLQQGLREVLQDILQLGDQHDQSQLQSHIAEKINAANPDQLREWIRSLARGANPRQLFGAG